MEEAKRLTNLVIEAVGDVDMVTFITVICNMGGQVVAHLADGKPSLIRLHANSIAENIKMKAIAKMLADDAARREEDNDD